MQKPITIASYTYPSEAFIYKAKLESEGILCFLKNENSINTDPLISNALGGVQLLVDAQDVMLAKQILSLIPNYLLDDEGDLLKCPKCQSETIEQLTSVKDIKSFLSFIFGLFLNVLPFYTKMVYKCDTCKFEFDKKRNFNIT